MTAMQSAAASIQHNNQKTAADAPVRKNDRSANNTRSRDAAPDSREQRMIPFTVDHTAWTAARVADGCCSFSLTALHDALPEWDRWLASQGVTRGHCIALPLRTDARSAASLLALLLLGQSILLWRHTGELAEGPVMPGTLPRFCRYVLRHAGGGQDCNNWAPGSSGLSLHPVALDMLHRPSPEVPLVYVSTSGTTGRPKISTYFHETLVANARNCLDRLRLAVADRVIVPVPLAHMYGLGAGFLPAVLAGASVRLVPEANLVRYLEAESEFDPTVAFLTPSFGQLLLKGRKQARAYRLTVFAGDRSDRRFQAEYESRHGCTVNLYGSTELGVIAAGDPQDSFANRHDTVGTPLHGVGFAAPEAEHAGRGQAYALRVSHPFGTAGYAGDDGMPVLPETLCRNGWYFTQDNGWVDADGRVRLLGRSDHCVKRDGMLVAFADVEQALLQIDGLEQVVVVAGCTTARGRELVAACVYALAGAAGGAAPVAPTSAAMVRIARRHLPGHAVPDRFLFLEALPLTATGKPDRLALAALASPSSLTKEDAAHATSE